MRLTAHLIDGQRPLALEPAERTRPWQGEHHKRCLPLMIANQAGWWIRNPVAFRARWDGGEGREALTIEAVTDGERPLAVSHFGKGVVTFSLPWLFKSEPGWNLQLRGPSNWPLDGATALEGIVETDWNPATATMNWQLTRPGWTVLFEAGFPFCQILPMRRGELEAVRLEQKPLADDAKLHHAFWAWAGARERFLAALPIQGSGPNLQGWQKDYHRGARTKLHLAELADA